MMPGMPRMPGPPGPTSQQNPLHLTFKNAHWPPNFITPENVLDYFCNTSNAFYEANCCNQQIKMQNITRSLEDCLQTMNGIQYVVWSAQPPLYVICKHRRNSPSNVTPLAYYYIINGVVYQAPDMYTYTQSRLLAAIDPLKKAFDEVVQYSRYNVAKGYFWDFKDKSSFDSKSEQDKEKEQPQQARSTNFQSRRTHELMQLLFEQFPPSAGVEIEEAPNSTEEEEDNSDMGQPMEGTGQGLSSLPPPSSLAQPMAPPSIVPVTPSSNQ